MSYKSFIEKVIEELTLTIPIINGKTLHHQKSFRIMDLLVVPIHRYPEYKMQCCRLMNSEWKRSETARLHSLESSCDNLPTCLILLKENRVIGHCKLSVLPKVNDACFIESVVIDATLRGQGYGAYLMKNAEEYCKNVLKLKTIYLSTHDKEGFYCKLGYYECEPVLLYGSVSLPMKCVSVVRDRNDECKLKPTTPVPLPPPMPASKTTILKKIYMKKEI